MNAVETRERNLVISPGTLFMSTVPGGFIFRLYTKVYAVDITYRPQMGVYVDVVENPSPALDSTTVNGVTTSKMLPNMDLLVETFHYPTLDNTVADQIMTDLGQYKGTNVGMSEVHLQSLRSFLYQHIDVEKTQADQLDVVLCDDLVLSYPCDEEEATKWGYVLHYKVRGKFVTTFELKLRANHTLDYHKEAKSIVQHPTGIDEGAGYAPGDDYRILKNILSREDGLADDQLATLFGALDEIKKLPQPTSVN